ncbi:hypothetical protein LY78DRAFT_126242 [Colletotrichum sublineola]|nr:hypothetical protein LY78DRAFT_126242 [Colletotrichum sublineola]
MTGCNERARSRKTSELQSCLKYVAAACLALTLSWGGSEGARFLLIPALRPPPHPSSPHPPPPPAPSSSPLSTQVRRRLGSTARSSAPLDTRQGFTAQYQTRCR